VRGVFQISWLAPSSCTFSSRGEGKKGTLGDINMDFKVFTAAFAAILVAELADKTQLIGLCLSAKSGRPFSVWAGSVAAYMIVTVVTVAAGAMLGKYLKPDLVRYVGAILFICIGILMFFGKL